MLTLEAGNLGSILSLSLRVTVGKLFSFLSLSFLLCKTGLEVHTMLDSYEESVMNTHGSSKCW